MIKLKNHGHSLVEKYLFRSFEEWNTLREKWFSKGHKHPWNIDRDDWVEPEKVPFILLYVYEGAGRHNIDFIYLDDFEDKKQKLQQLQEALRDKLIDSYDCVVWQDEWQQFKHKEYNTVLLVDFKDKIEVCWKFLNFDKEYSQKFPSDGELLLECIEETDELMFKFVQLNIRLSKELIDNAESLTPEEQAVIDKHFWDLG
jgi:hypothetical protein